MIISGAWNFTIRGDGMLRIMTRFLSVGGSR